MRTAKPETLKLNALVTTIRGNLMTNPKWVEAAILALYAKQTSDEQATQETGHDNRQGFNKPDARRMSFVAEFLKSGKHLTREKALGTYGRKLQKYAGQLARIAMAKQAQATVTPPVQAPRPVENRCDRCGVVRCPDGCCCAC